MMDKQEANKLIAEKLGQIDALYAECEKLADEFDISFCVDGPTYGMGGYYNPTRSKDGSYYEDGWLASSHSC